MSNDNFKMVKDESASVVSEDVEGFEEEKVANTQNKSDLTRTRIGDIDKSSMDHAGILSKS